MAITKKERIEASRRALKPKSYSPPGEVRRAARRALDLRESLPSSKRGMTPVGLARANQLANGRPVSAETLRRMVSYFDRHEVDKSGEGWGQDSKGYQAWLGWGGDPGRAWARRLLRTIDSDK